jgi:CheY-like chemotaxis protein
MRILIVEDSPLVQRMYGLAFPGRQHTLVTAANGREALDLLAQADTPFDLILLDLRMPDMNGVEFLAALQCRRAPGIPVILTTAERPDSGLIQEARMRGAAAVVHKPWKPQELQEVVRQVIPQAIA